MGWCLYCLSSSKEINNCVHHHRGNVLPVHLQFSMLHVGALSNRVHRSHTVSNMSEIPVGEKTSYLSFLNRAQPAFCSQLTGLSAVFSWIVPMVALP